MDCSCHFTRVDQKSTSKSSNVLTKKVKMSLTFIKHGHCCLEEFSIPGFAFYCESIKAWVDIPRRRGPVIAGQIAWTHILWLKPCPHFPSKFSTDFSNFNMLTNYLGIMSTSIF